MEFWGVSVVLVIGFLFGSALSEFFTENLKAKQLLTYWQPLTSSSGTTEWYANLNRPVFEPAAGLFGPVLVLTCCFQSVAVCLTWQRGGGFDGCASAPLFLFGLQLLLLWSWSPMFFGLHRVFDALVLLLLLDFMIAVTIVFMQPLSWLACALMLPSLFWQLWATAVNFYIWKHNCSFTKTPCKD